MEVGSNELWIPSRQVIDRRRFLVTSSAVGLAIVNRAPWVQAGQNGRSTELVKGKDPRLIVLQQNPAVLETPTELLAQNPLTPVELLFVRNNQLLESYTTISPPDVSDWQVRFTGLLNRELTVGVSEIAAIDQVEFEMVLQCSGNSRSLYAQSAKTSGTQWGRGGMGNVRFEGVPLARLLEKKQIEINSKAKYLAAEGKDGPLPGKEDFEHSLPLDDVLSKSIIALKLNGKPLPAIHGGPVRLVTPGIYGTMHIKWLSRLRFEANETANHNHIPRYRVPKEVIRPGEKIEYTFENSDFNWKMKVKSVVLRPVADETLRNREVNIQGVAFNDGQAAIETVLISIDQGQSWRRAQLRPPKSPYAWTEFRSTITLTPGHHTIWTRAIDALGRSQPIDGSIHWNPSGYEWNGVEKIAITVA